MKSSNLKQELLDLIEKRIKRFNRQMPAPTFISLNSAIADALTTWFHTHQNPFEVKMDVLDLIINTLREHEKELDRAVEDLVNLTSKNGELTTRSRRVGNYRMGLTTDLTVRSQGRITVGHCFKEGTRLDATPLFDGEPHKGPAQGLVLMRSHY